MFFDCDDPAFAKFRDLICPDCGGKLLRGRSSGVLNHSVTCRDCLMCYYIAIKTEPPYQRPGSDTEFREIVSVLVWERIGSDIRSAAYYDPKMPPRRCDYCSEEYTGPAVYCCLACALADNGALCDPEDYAIMGYGGVPPSS